jgi:type II secretion system protein N
VTGRPTLLKTAGLVAAGLFLFLGLVYLFLPTGRINRLVNRHLEAQGLSLSPAAHKTLLPGLGWDSPRLSSSEGELVSCERVAIRLRLLPLLAGRVRLAAYALVGNGRLDLEYGLNGRELLALDSSGITLADIPLFASVLGGRVNGDLWIKGNVARGEKGLNGQVKVEVKRLSFSGVRLGAFQLPDGDNLRSQGMIRIFDNRIRIESLTLQGEGVYMRVSGNIVRNGVDAPLDLKLEIMPTPAFLERQKLVFLLLTRFMISPGNYRMPIHGTLLKPEIL